MGQTDARLRRGMTAMAPAKDAVRHAATVILWRPGPTGPEVLMGQRGAKAAFMPNKVVFPGGAVDPEDTGIALAADMNPICHGRLAADPEGGVPQALLAAAIRETWEETGLILGRLGDWPDPPAAWADFAATGHRPSAAGFRFVFRAITPPGRPRRFDARFFLVSASAVQGDAGDFSRASDELSHLRWIPLARVREVDLPFITEVVLAEVEAILEQTDPPESVPFVRNDDVVSQVRRLR